MIVSLRDGRRIDIELNPLTESGYDKIKYKASTEKESLEYSEFNDVDDFELEDYKKLRYRREVYVDGELAGVAHLDIIYFDEEFREFTGGVYLFKKFRGMGLNSVILDTLANISCANRIYIVIKLTNIASLKSSYGYTIINHPIKDTPLEDCIGDGETIKEHIVLCKTYR